MIIFGVNIEAEFSGALQTAVATRQFNLNNTMLRLNRHEMRKFGRFQLFRSSFVGKILRIQIKSIYLKARRLFRCFGLTFAIQIAYFIIIIIFDFNPSFLVLLNCLQRVFPLEYSLKLKIYGFLKGQFN